MERNLGKDFRIKIQDTQLLISLKAAAERHDISLEDLSKKFLTLGLILKKVEMDPQLSLTRRDKAGFETDASTIFNDILVLQGVDQGIRVKKSSKIGFLKLSSSTRYKGVIDLKVPGPLSDELMEFANMHQTTAENVFAGILEFGLNALNEEKQNSHSYIYRDDSDAEAHLTIF